MRCLLIGILSEGAIYSYFFLENLIWLL
ncbi:uncharacterized protein METZ01_LOCUS481545 [marine metagenome]|uniref:Uncharacterized protein n=1 Tax=marine metagenome TaxID=408172 RepID=A0A383C947_9ZZZZ